MDVQTRRKIVQRIAYLNNDTACPVPEIVDRYDSDKETEPWSECESIEDFSEEVAGVARGLARRATRWAGLAGALKRQAMKAAEGSE